MTMKKPKIAGITKFRNQIVNVIDKMLSSFNPNIPQINSATSDLKTILRNEGKGIPDCIKKIVQTQNKLQIHDMSIPKKRRIKTY